MSIASITVSEGDLGVTVRPWNTDWDLPTNRALGTNEFGIDDRGAFVQTPGAPAESLAILAIDALEQPFVVSGDDPLANVLSVGTRSNGAPGVQLFGMELEAQMDSVWAAMGPRFAKARP